MKSLLTRKVGMTRIFTPEGTEIPVTILRAEATKVLSLREKDKHGYVAAVVGVGAITKNRNNKTLNGQFIKAGVEAMREIRELPLDKGEEVQVGQEIGVSVFEGVNHVKVVGTSKGRGFAGTIKRHNFSRGPKTHGSKNVREPGSQSAHSYPARVFPGKKLNGHYGDAQITVKNLKLVKIDAENHLLFLEGAVPGPINGQVEVRKG